MVWEGSLGGWRAQLMRYNIDLRAFLKLIKICSTEETALSVTVTE
jgi:hypothetical protein